MTKPVKTVCLNPGRGESSFSTKAVFPGIWTIIGQLFVRQSHLYNGNPFTGKTAFHIDTTLLSPAKSAPLGANCRQSADWKFWHYFFQVSAFQSTLISFVDSIMTTSSTTLQHLNLTPVMPWHQWTGSCIQNYKSITCVCFFTCFKFGIKTKSIEISNENKTFWANKSHLKICSTVTNSHRSWQASLG